MVVVELAASAECVDAHHLFVGTRNRAPDYKRGISIDHKIHTLTRALSAKESPRALFAGPEKREREKTVGLFHDGGAAKTDGAPLPGLMENRF